MGPGFNDSDVVRCTRWSWKLLTIYSSLFYSLNHDRHDHLHASSNFRDRRTRISILHCKTAPESSFNSMVNIFDHHCIISIAQYGLGHSLVEVERSWRIVSQTSILWVHFSQFSVRSPYVTLAPVDVGLENSPTKFHSFYVHNQSVFDMPPSPEVDDAWEALYSRS